MEGTSIAYKWGFGAGVVVGLVLVGIVIRLLLGRKSKRSREYDERQKLAQGIAYKYGYYTLLGYLAAVSLFDLMTGVRWCSLYTGVFLGVLLSVGVFGIVGICNDAYFPFRENPGRYIALFAVLGAMNVVIGVSHYLHEGTFMQDGMLSHSVVNPLAGVLLLLLAGAMAAKRQREKRETE